MGNTIKPSNVHEKSEYRVAEIFDTVQGEGYWMGVPATFIRLQGCPVHCSWCDSEYTWGKGGKTMSTTEILDKVGDYSRHIVITGGEPMIQNLDALIRNLKQTQHYIQIETSGYNWYKGKERAHWITVSPKPPLKFRVPVEFHRYAKEFKWVVDDDLQWDTIWNSWKFSLLERSARQVYPVFSLMPEGCPPRKEMVEKSLDFLRCVPYKVTRNWMYSDRIQWRIGVR